jgi:hypothetical protein
MKKLLALLAMVAMTQNASAITSTFTFDVLSSGPDIYVCNAGIKHKNPSGTVSDQQGNGTVSTDDPGEYLQDVMEYRFGTWDVWTHQLNDGNSNTRAKASGNNNFVAANGSSSMKSNQGSAHKSNYGKHNEKSKVLTFLQFELSSERFGTEYFVDVCYYGPRFHSGPVGTHFAASAKAMFKNIHHNNYRSLSKLKVKAELYCDGKKKLSKGWYSANANKKTLWKDVNIGGKAPEKCVTRYSFKEDTTKRRPNGKHGARVELKTEITDPSN